MRSVSATARSTCAGTATISYFLEVSPAYTPNPPPTAEFADRPYAEFKAQITGAGNYTAAFADLVFEQHRLLVAAWGL